MMGWNRVHVTGQSPFFDRPNFIPFLFSGFPVGNGGEGRNYLAGARFERAHPGSFGVFGGSRPSTFHGDSYVEGQL